MGRRRRTAAEIEEETLEPLKTPLPPEVDDGVEPNVEPDVAPVPAEPDDNGGGDVWTPESPSESSPEPYGFPRRNPDDTPPIQFARPPLHQPPPPAYTEPPPAVSTVPEGAVQHLVKQRVNGRPTELGVIDVRATVDDIVERWYAALNLGGTVMLYPVGMDGDVVDGWESMPSIIDISPAHEAIGRVRQKLAISGSLGVGVPGGVGIGGQVDVVGMIQALMGNQAQQATQTQQVLNAANKRAEAAETRAADFLDNMSSERLQMSVTHQTDMHKMYDKVQERQATDSRANLTYLTTLMTGQQAASKERHEQQLVRSLLQ